MARARHRRVERPRPRLDQPCALGRSPVKDMRNTNDIETNSNEAAGGTPRGRRAGSPSAFRHRKGAKLLAVGAVIATGGMIGTGFAVQSAFAAENERIAATSAIRTGAERDAAQLATYGSVLVARSTQSAQKAISDASGTVQAATGKADATQLNASLAMVSNYKLLAPERVFELAKTIQAQIPPVQAAVAEADRVAAEQAAAEQAAQAAAQAAAADAAAKAKASSSSSSSSGGGGGSRPSAPTDPSGAQAIARDMMASQYGWGDDQFGCLVALWNRESHWNANAYNPSSGAGGIPQALPASKMASAGADWQTNPATQIAWGLGYISGRWGTPCGAWDHSESAGWY